MATFRYLFFLLGALGLLTIGGILWVDSLFLPPSKAFVETLLGTLALLAALVAGSLARESRPYSWFGDR